MAKKTAQPGAPQPKKPKQKKIRLDDLLIQRGYFADRGEALRAVLAHEVRANDVYPTSAAVLVSPDADVFVRNRRAYVSRGGHKLQGALDAFAQDVRGARCIDIGSSTGGFTDCLLQQGASKVFAIDVGYGQLAWKIRSDPRVVVMERTNIRYVTPEDLGEPLDLSVVDVSFISLKIVLPAIQKLLKPTGQVLCLIKPQFEAGKENVGKKGVVRDPAVHAQVLRDFTALVASLNFTIRNLTFSPVKGPEGNIEFLAHLSMEPGENHYPPLHELVEQAHAALKG